MPEINSVGAPHGGIRGGEGVRRSRSFEGRFGRMFRNLPAAAFQSDEDLLELGKSMSHEPVANPPAVSNLPAGYTYVAQFIDHDLTFDPASSLQRANDVDALVDYRTPRFDLDCVYGRGPDDQPYLYKIRLR